jgi:hypothetical protein
MDFYTSLFKEWPFILRINLVLSLCFLGMALMLISLVFYLRIHKNIQDKRKQSLEVTLLNFINSYLFDDDFNKPEEMLHLKTTHLKTDYDKKLAIKQILMFHENLKGESTTAIKELFYALGLHAFVVSDLKILAWHQKARAIYVCSQLSIKIPRSLIDAFILDKRREVRQQALLYVLNLAEKDPLYFLDNMDRPLTLWEQIYIGNGLKNAYQGQIPDFSQWLDHKITSIVEFAIKMMAEHNQFANAPALMDLLWHKEESIRKEAIRSLGKMEHDGLVSALISNFAKETLDIKYEILKIIKDMGTHEQLKSLSPAIFLENKNIQVDYYKVGRHLRPELKFNRAISY